MTSARDKWEEFLDPDVLRGKLISASIYIAAYEMLKESIVGRIRDDVIDDAERWPRIFGHGYKWISARAST